MISKEMFHSWKHDEVTIKLMETLEIIKNSVQESMTNPSIIMELDSRAKLHRLAGVCEGLDVVLNLAYDTFNEEIDDEDDTVRT